MGADDPLRARLAALKPAPRGQDPSPARARIREVFKDITAARERRVTWAQIAELLDAEGVRDPHGDRLTVDEVRALYHAERQLLVARKERRKGKTAGAPERRPAVSPEAQPSVPPPRVEAPPVAQGEPAPALVPPAPAGASEGAPTADAERAARLREALAKARRPPLPEGSGAFDHMTADDRRVKGDK